MNDITMKLQADNLIRLALQEDITSEDVSTNAVMPMVQMGEVELIAKEDGVIAGLDVYARVFLNCWMRKRWLPFYCKDGDVVTCGQRMATVHGDIRVLLSGERVALNYLQRMRWYCNLYETGGRSVERQPCDAVGYTKDNTKLPYFLKNMLSVSAVDVIPVIICLTVLLKDNHIGAAGSITKAVQMAKAYAPFVRKIEIEVETLEQVKEAVDAGADIIMLDNMTPDMMKEAVQLIDGRAQTECSGNITKENIAKICEIGVDFVSSGALTHSAPILDISMKNLHPVEA